jgi:hypothetical protein
VARIGKEERKGHWSESFSLQGYGGLLGHDVSPDPKLVPIWTYFVKVCGFTFQFGSVAQIEAVLVYYSRKLHPSSRMPDSKWLRAEHDVAQAWYDRLPGYLRKEPKRRRVVKALERALVEFEPERGRFPVQESKASNLPIVGGE